VRASLVSATSLLALLIADEGIALATPTLTDGGSQSGATIGTWTGADAGQGYVLVGQTGTATTTIVATSLSGSILTVNAPGAGTGFTRTSGATTSINTNNSTNIAKNFSFVPLTSGAYATTIAVTDNNANSNSLALTLSGTGVAPTAAVSGTVGGYLLIGTGNTLSLTVSNTGNGDLVNKNSTIGNLFGTIGTASSVFSATAKTISVYDSNSTATGATTSTVSNFTYTPVTTGGTGNTVGSTKTATVNTTVSNGVGVSNAGGTFTTTLTGTLVAPVASISSTSSTNYFLVGQSTTATVNISNTGNGGLSGQGTLSNLRGTIGAVGSTISSAAQSISIGDTSTTTYNYTFSPTLKGQTIAPVVVATFSNGSSASTNAAFNYSMTLTGTGVAPVESVTKTTTSSTIRVGSTVTDTVTISNTGNGNLSGLGSASNLNGAVAATLGAGYTAGTGASNGSTISIPDASTSTLTYNYIPTARGTSSSSVVLNFSNGSSNGSNTGTAISSVFTNTALGPVYSSTFNANGVVGASSTGTATATANGAIGAASQTISFGTVGFKKTATVYLDIGNITNDNNGGNANLTNLSIEKFSIAGAASAYFSASTTGVITEGGNLVLPITVTNNYGAGTLNSSLTIFTDESAGLGGTGDTFTYSLTALAVPEPASMAILGAGLAGLAGLHRRRKAARS
jgi:hypothetical protein